MKKLYSAHFVAWALVVVMPLWFGSCKKSDDNPVVAPTTTVEGSYKVTALKADPKVLGQFDDLIAASKLLFANTSCLTDLTITFKSGGDATTDSPTSCTAIPVSVSTFTGVDASSKWSLSGKRLTITKSDATKTEYTIVNSTSTTMQLQWQGLLNYPTPSTTVYTFTMDLKKP